MWTPEDVKTWLAFSPREPGNIAPHLRGWLIGQHFYCSTCAGRVAGRGIMLPRGSVPVWDDAEERHTCAACGKTP